MRRIEIKCVTISTLAVFAFPVLGQVSYGTAGSTYSQAFDSLPATGTSNAWINNATLAGWYAFEDGGGSIEHGIRNSTAPWNAMTVIRAGDGTFITSRLWSLGVTGSNERSLGSIGASQDRVLALVLLNTTGETLTQFTLTYNGELWNNAGGSAETLDFDYAIFAAAPGLAELRADTVAPYSNPGGVGGVLDFTTPASATGILNGNLPENRTAGITGSVAINWPAGEFLVLRWWDDDRGLPSPIDHKLAIDNLSFVAIGDPPSSCGSQQNGCFADYNADGGIDGDDVIAFFADWDQGDICADTDASDGVDGDDVILFFASWDVGGAGTPGC